MNGETPDDRSERLDLAAIRAKLNRVRGQQYWRSLEEVAATPEFTAMLQREFPPGASEWWDGVSRRNFLKLAAASLALAGLTACTKQPAQSILPYVNQPENLVPGEPLFYATSMLFGGFATGVLVKSREGHPVKVEGNPQHPSSLGGSSIWMQASLLDLYEPDRSQSVAFKGDLSTWALFLADLTELTREQTVAKGSRLRFLTETITSPTLAAQMGDLLLRFPQAKWHQFEPVTRDNVREGARLAFGDIVETHYRFDKASVILSLDADFLHTHPDRLRYARHFADGRRVSAGRREMNRLYVAESTPTITGTMAEHRLPISSSGIEQLARSVIGRLGISGHSKLAESGSQTRWLDAVVRELQQHPGTSIVIAGEWQPPNVHALAHLLNQTLGNVGKTVFYTESAEANPVNQLQSLRELTQEMKAGNLDALFILGGNPAFTAPVDMEFGSLLSRVKRSIHLSLHLDETSALCTWHIPQTHYLESWGDARSFDGTVSLLQPLIAPLYNGKSGHELLHAVIKPHPPRSDYEIVRAFWESQKLWPDFDKGWRKSLHEGFIAGTESKLKQVPVTESFLRGPASDRGSRIPDHESPVRPIELSFRPDPSIWDGRFANNGWLQECPKPVSKLTWDNAVLVSPDLAERLQLSNDDVVELTFLNRTLRGGVWIMPGQAQNSVTLQLGFGRVRAGRAGDGVGFNTYALRPSDAFWFSDGLQIARTSARHHLVTTQKHHNIDSPERQIHRAGTLQEFLARPDFVKHSMKEPKPDETLYDPSEFPYTGYKWGMSIDLTTCIGCNSCVVACQVENNIPVVGKDQVNRNREMLWLRVDTYFEGSLDNPAFHHMPVPCMHCEHAPCELVCPVEATVHDREGLNTQVYNRCVGTRFCSNNCPYKVRRFNFLQYADYHLPNLEPMYNPDVTVRWRGVMEKCTYCVQRIARARITAEKENRRVQDGEILTACQPACPTDAIVFGDLNDPNSKVARLKQIPLDYSMLGQLNTRPRTTYLAKVQNPVSEQQGKQPL